MAGKESGRLEKVWTGDLSGVEDGSDEGAIGEVLGAGEILVRGDREGEAGRKRSLGRICVSEVDVDEESGEVVLK